LAFAASLLAFSRCRVDLQGLPSPLLHTPLWYERLKRPSWTSQHLQSACLCPGPALAGPPLLGFVHNGCLASDCPYVRPLPTSHTPPESGGFPAFGLMGASPPDQVPPSWFDHLDGLLRTQGPGYIATRCRTRFTAFRVDDPSVLPFPDPHEQARICQFAVADENAIPP